MISSEEALKEPTGLSRFRDAQRKDFETALGEIRSGRKRTHWMWYVFPQIRGLGSSSMSEYYGIRDLAQAREYLSDPYLGGNLREICRELLSLDTDDAGVIFGYPDELKLRSSMTLFSLASGGDPLFDAVLDRLYDGKKDMLTLKLLDMA